MDNIDNPEMVYSTEEVAYTTHFTQEVAIKIAFLIGVSVDNIRKFFDTVAEEKFNDLLQSKEACIIRYLCKIRTALFRHFNDVDSKIKYDLKNIDRIDYFDVENIKQLRHWGIEVVRANCNANSYTISITELINKHINNCANLFDIRVPWEYIKDLFVIPSPQKDGVVKNEANKFNANIGKYPYGMYMHWNPVDEGNVIFNDKKFLEILYEQHNDTFTIKDMIKDANTTTDIYDFIADSDKLAIAVDCENTDIYKLLSVLLRVKEDWPEDIQKIERITLINDPHTTNAWDLLEKYIDVPVEMIEVERILENKSLVDIKLTVEVSKDYCQNGVTSFIIVSSDSDYWPLITSFPDANFMVMYEKSKCSNIVKKALGEHGSYYCCLDDFTTKRAEALRTTVLESNLKSYFPNIIGMNAHELAKTVYRESRTTADKQEIENFYNKYIKKLRLKIDKNDTFVIEITE